MSQLLTGSICLSDIPRDQIKKIMCRDGVERCYLNIAVVELSKPQSFMREGGKQQTYTHFVSCAPRREERVEGVNYYIGNLETRVMQPSVAPSAEDVANAPFTPIKDDDLPF